MRGFQQKRGQVTGIFSAGELEALQVVVREYLGLLDKLAGASASASEAASPFEAWEAELDANLTAPSDPALMRLFPDAYPDDPEASAEFRRFSQDDQRIAKVEAANVVLTDLERAQNGCVLVTSEHVEAWLSTLAALRLALSVRLGVDASGEPAPAPESGKERDLAMWLAAMYDWLGWVLESLLAAID